MIKPISPKDIPSADIPDYVINVVNNLIISKFNHSLSKAVVQQDDIVDGIMVVADARIRTRQDIFDKRFLNFEQLYRQNGWTVRYDKPSWGYSYKAFFEFSFDSACD